MRKLTIIALLAAALPIGLTSCEEEIEVPLAEEEVAAEDSTATEEVTDSIEAEEEEDEPIELAGIAALIDANPNLQLLSQAIQATGLAQRLSYQTVDTNYEPSLYEDVSVWTGSQWDYCFVPDEKKYGFTVFACPDDVLAEKYSITDLQSFYDYAHGIYGGDELDLSDKQNMKKLQDAQSPLRRLIAYNILKSKGQYDELTTICTIETALMNPTEWYATLDTLTTIKVEQLRVTGLLDRSVDTYKDLYLNRGDYRRGYSDIQGVHVSSTVDGDYENEAENGIYFLTDGLADYGEQTKAKVFDTRLRADLYTLMPELMTNGIRDGRTNNYISNSNLADKSVASPNYWFPKGYLENVTYNNEDVFFFFESQHNTYWSYEGDMFMMTTESEENADITITLPSVPTGTYQLRVGVCRMTTCGYANFYVDGALARDSVNMTSVNAQSGWFSLLNSGYSTAEAAEAKAAMHEEGWWHGPRSVFNYGTEGTKDGTSSATKNYFCNNVHTIRLCLGEFYLSEGTAHTLRIVNWSQWKGAAHAGMLDYIELVPQSVYTGDEDDY